MIAVLALCLFVVVRPTAVAKNYVMAVESGDYSSFSEVAWIHTIRAVNIRLLPRDLSDVCNFRRRISLHLDCKYLTKDDGTPEVSYWTTECQATAGLVGIQVHYMGQFETQRAQTPSPPILDPRNEFER
jgi:hypothetical protein